ncbi:hypothetical protein [Alteromonas aestuariivivens]|nr:hypothetical protein [Alteromonas aestuariivivens]
MELTFKEKSAWISFICTIGIFGYYFVELMALSGSDTGQTRTAALWLLGKILIMSVVVESVFHGMLAVANPSGAQMNGDERDRHIEQKANQYGYYVLSTGVIIVIGRMVVLEVFPGFDEARSSLAIPMLTMHMLMFSFVLSELTRFGAQILMHRWGE